MKKAEEANAYYDKQPEKMHLYDAGESVQNMPIKKTEESHKKCTPGEFGMNKEGQANLLRAITKLAADPRAMDMSGGGPDQMSRLNRYRQGSMNNAARSLEREQEYLAGDKQEMNEISNDMGRAQLGAQAAQAIAPTLPYVGPYAGAAARGANNAISAGKMIHDQLNAPSQINDSENEVADAQNQFSASLAPGNRNAPAPRQAAKPVGGVPGVLNAAAKSVGNIKMPSPQRMFHATHPRRPFDMPATPAASAPAAPAAPATPALPVKASAYSFGTAVKRALFNKQAADGAPSSNLAAAGYLGANARDYAAPVGGGAALGAIGGGLMGAMNPGEEEEYDDRGNVIGKKRKSRLGAALGGAMAGGAAGGALGAGAKYFGMLGQDKPLSLPTPSGAQTPESPARVQLGDTGKMTPKQTVLARQPKFNRYKASPEAMSYNDAAKAMDANPFTPVQ